MNLCGGVGELIKEDTTFKYMHHVIPVILYLCLAVKSVIATTTGLFPQIKNNKYNF